MSLAAVREAMRQITDYLDRHPETHPPACPRSKQAGPCACGMQDNVNLLQAWLAGRDAAVTGPAGSNGCHNLWCVLAPGHAGPHKTSGEFFDADESGARMLAEYKRIGLEAFETRYGIGRHLGVHPTDGTPLDCPGCERERRRKR